MDIREGLTFDDVLLVPQHSEIDSRSTGVDISVKMGDLTFKHPVIPANMLTVTGREMAWSVIESGGLAILNRFIPIQEQLKIAENVAELGRLSGTDHFAVSVGIKEEDKKNLSHFSDLGVKVVCVDIAHGDSKHCEHMTYWIRENFPHMLIIAGNVATGEGAGRLWRAGADAVKVGVGPGSLCTTRVETGNGVPQLSALIDVAEKKASIVRNRFVNGPLYVIADGGIKNAGDIVKALCFADMVMAGNLFAGCQESPGKTHTINGQCFKEYVGSSTHKTNHVEGVEAWVPCKGSFKDLLTKLLEGLRSGCSYQGCASLDELKDNPTFIRITNAGLKESHPHDVIVK